MKHELWYSVVVRDRHGKVLSRERRRSRSFLKQWNQSALLAMRYGVTVQVRDTANILRTASHDVKTFKIAAPAGTAAFGIVVGTGDTPVDIEDYILEAKIGQGVGAGQMEYHECTVADYVVADPSCYFISSRVITNNSGGLITVKEAGIYSYIGVYICCSIRDVLTVPLAVPNGGSITIDWAIQVTA